MTKHHIKSPEHLASNLGRTMIETLMVISLYGLLTLSLYKLVSNVFTANEDSTAVVEISKIVDGLHSLYKWHDIPSSPSLSDLQYAMREGIIENSDSGCADGTATCDPAKAVAPIGDSINLTTRYAKVTKNATDGFSETSCTLTEVQNCQKLEHPTVVERPKKGTSYYDCTLTSGTDGYDSTFDEACTNYDTYINTTLPDYQTNAIKCSDTLSSCKHIFSLTLSGITESQCRKLASTDWGDSFYRVNSDAHSGYLSSNDENYPFREIDVKGLCIGATSIILDFF